MYWSYNMIVFDSIRFRLQKLAATWGAHRHACSSKQFRSSAPRCLKNIIEYVTIDSILVQTAPSAARPRFPTSSPWFFLWFRYVVSLMSSFPQTPLLRSIELLSSAWFHSSSFSIIYSSLFSLLITIFSVPAPSSSSIFFSSTVVAVMQWGTF